MGISVQPPPRGFRPLTRVQPKHPVKAMVTYRAAEKVVFGDAATCAEVNCIRWRRGWVNILPRGSAAERTLRDGAAGRIDHLKRTFREEEIEGGLVRFIFGPLQPCFGAKSHRFRLAGKSLYVVRGGDWRQHLGNIRTHSRPADWVEDFALNQQGVQERLKRG